MYPILCHSKDKHSNFPSNHKKKKSTKKFVLYKWFNEWDEILHRKEKRPNIIEQIEQIHEQVRCKEVLGLGYQIKSMDYLM